jgi:hypothetical protein
MGNKQKPQLILRKELMSKWGFRQASHQLIWPQEQANQLIMMVLGRIDGMLQVEFIYLSNC